MYDQNNLRHTGIISPIGTIPYLPQPPPDSLSPPSGSHLSFLVKEYPPDRFKPLSRIRLAIIDSDSNVGLYEFQPQCTHSHSSKSPIILPVVLGNHCISSRPRTKETHSELRACDGGFSFYFDGDKGPLLTHIIESGAGSIDLHEIQLLVGFETTCWYYSLCLATGRLVFTTENGDVFVVDYLPIPSI